MQATLPTVKMANIAKILNITVLVGLVISWIVELAGVAKTENNCVDGAGLGAGGKQSPAVN